MANKTPKYQVPCVPCTPMASSKSRQETPTKSSKKKRTPRSVLAKPVRDRRTATKPKAKIMEKEKAPKMRSCRPGVYTRNPFFNFLREFRKMHCGLKVTEIAKQGAIEWRKLSAERKISYYKRSRNVPIANKYCRC